MTLHSDISIYVALCAVALAASYIKGVTGTGAGTIIMSFASFIIAPKAAVVIVCFLSVLSSLTMLRVDAVKMPKAYWVPIAIVITLTSIMGAAALDYVPTNAFKVILGTSFLLLALWFILQKRAPAASGAPLRASGTDLAVSAFSGFCGGLVGANAAPLVAHFGKVLDKQYLRRLFVIIFLPAAIGQTVTFIVNGLFTWQVFLYCLVMVPATAAGIYLGNHSHKKLSEPLFRKILAAFLVVAALRLIWQGSLS